MISHDFYYYSNDNLSFGQRLELNYDYPDSFEMQKLIEDLRTLECEHCVDIPSYDYKLYIEVKIHRELI